MPSRAISCKVCRKCTSATSSSAGACKQNWRASNPTHPRGHSSAIDGWPGTETEVTRPVAKTSWSIWDIVGSIVVAVRRGRARLSVRSYFGDDRVGLIPMLGVIWKEWLREIKTRREVTEELSCRTSVLPSFLSRDTNP